MFTTALLDEGPDLNALPNKLWTSRAHVQKQHAPYIAATVQSDISSMSSVDAIVEGVQHLMILSGNPPSKLDSTEQCALYITPTIQNDIAQMSSVDAIV